MPRPLTKVEASEPLPARPAIRIRDLRKTFGQLIAVDGVSLDIAHGEFFMIVGPSGCGKTTLLRIWEEHKKTVVFITHSVDEAVFLGDRIMVMTAQPGKVKMFVPVALARPRNIMELQKLPQYGELIAHIWSSLRDEVHRARQQEEEMKS